jgi:hypothetical protein
MAQEKNAKQVRTNWRAASFVSLIVLALILFLSVVPHLQSFQNCKCANQQLPFANTINKQEASFIVYLVCYGTFLEAHNGLVSALTGAFIVLFTATLWWATKQLQTASAEQSLSMDKSIRESARAANAMEGVAASFAENVNILKDRTARQMRAYVCVVVNTATFQDRANDLKFASIPAMLNTGNTPAYKVSFRAAADILPVPLPDDFSFPLPDDPVGSGTLGHTKASL